jgi:NitT/TauT family transport system substrate-binding protein
MMSRLNSILPLLFLVLLAPALVACGGTTAAPGSAAAPVQNMPLQVCMAHSPLLAVPVYAREQGLYEKFGLDAELITFDSGTTAVTALIAGDCDVVYVAGSAAANAVAAGHELALVAGLVNRQLYSLIVSPEIATAGDLRGKIVAASRPGGAADSVMRAALRRLGLEPDEDVTIMMIEGGQGNRLAAMETGQVAGTVMSVPEASRAIDLGYRVLLDPSDMDSPYQHTVIVIPRETLQADRPTIKAFLEAIIEATARAKQDRPGAMAAMAAVLEMDQQADDAFLDAAYDQLILEYLESVPYPDRAGVQALLDEAARENEAAASVDVDAIIDTSLIDELEDEGFFANLPGQ